MAYWLEAMTHARLLWGLDDASAARGALARLAPDPAARLRLAGTPRERAYGAAVEALYMDADLPTRARAFADSLRALRQRYPGDLDAAAFASVALQMALDADAYARAEENAVREEAITLAEQVFASLPEHPGGAHYLIHATDHPALAQRGLSAARAYARIAPDAEHALHMPSHIFLQLGMWDDVVTANERAWAASRAWVSAGHGGAVDLDFHALAWLQYGYLQQGRRRASLALIDSARAVLARVDLSANGAVDARHVVARLQFMHALETDEWDVWAPVGIEAGADVDTTSQRARFFAANADYQRAIAATLRGDTVAAVEAEARFAGRVVVESQLKALRAHARGDREAGLALLARAAEAEANVPHVGPPNVVPSHELYGTALIAAGKFSEAAEAFRSALQLMPNRSAALLGLARALAGAGDGPGAAAAYQALVANLHTADPDLAILSEAQLYAR